MRENYLTYGSRRIIKMARGQSESLRREVLMIEAGLVYRRRGYLSISLFSKFARTWEAF